MQLSSTERGPGGRSTRVKIGLTFAMLALVLFVAVGGISGNHVRNEITRQSGSTLNHMASRLAGSIDAGLFERYREIQNLSALQLLIGSQVEPAAWRALSERLQSTMPYYSWIGVADLQGKVVAATGGVLEGRDVSARPWFAQGREGPFVGDVHDAVLLASLLPRSGDNEPLRLLDFAAPVSHAGRATGVLGAHLDLRWAEQMRRSALSATDAVTDVEVIVVNQSGAVLLGPAAPRLGSWSRAEIDSVSREAPGLREWSDGGSYLTAAVRTTGYGDYPGLGWTVVVRQPAAAALAPALDLQRRIWLYGLMGAMLFGAAGWWLAGWLTAPLKAVALEASKLVNGDPAAGARIDHPNEVAQLASSLGTLVGQLRQREQALVELTASLETRVADRTASLDQANADLRSFGRSVSHDLRGPIAAMGQMLKVVLDSPRHPLSPDTREVVALLGAECIRMTKLVDELMLLAQVEVQPLQRVAVPMKQVVDTVLTALADGRTQVSVGRPLPIVEGDPILLRQVWQNLLSNAFKFSAKVPSPQVVIDWERSGKEFLFRISDNGAGFDPAQADQLFGAFRRLHSAAEFPGTGVGLSIVKRIVHRHGGRLGATSGVGDGASFWFSLPVMELPMADAEDLIASSTVPPR